MAFITRDQITAAVDLPSEDIEVPEWGGTVRIRTMTGTERDSFEGSIQLKGGGVNFENMRARLLSRCLVDEEGKRLFSDKDMDVLGGKSALVLNRLFEVAARINGITSKDVDELVKN